jgi:L-alanine-DL-glutamate epimerase-like enolase superfamily enzyme
MLSTRLSNSSVVIKRIDVSAYTIPTVYTSTSSQVGGGTTYAFPESDGTYTWDKTTIVVVEAHAGNVCGLGYTYADVATAMLIKHKLVEVVQGRDAMAVPGCWLAMVEAIRNLGRPGISSMAIAAVDAALWDLKARLLDLPLVTLLGASHAGALIYGSGGFISYSREQLQQQLRDWVEQGISRVKMKLGRNAQVDIRRVREAREAISPETALFVDANGAYSRKEALAMANYFAEEGVTWFEEPVSSDDLEGLRLIRDRAPAGMEIAAGEYGYDLGYFRRMLEAGAVDVLQADATRCAGITGFLRVGALCEARSLSLSAHCGPSIHVHACCALPNFRHLEYFHDHVHIEHMLFEGALTPKQGILYPDLSRPGMGLELRKADAAKYAV